MKITMLAEISGLRDGVPWPNRGESITVPDDEAEQLIGNALAKKYEKADVDEVVAVEPPKGPEAAVEPIEPETATSPDASKPAPKPPRRRTPAGKAAPKAQAKG